MFFLPRYSQAQAEAEASRITTESAALDPASRELDEEKQRQALTASADSTVDASKLYGICGSAVLLPDNAFVGTVRSSRCSPDSAAVSVTVSTRM